MLTAFIGWLSSSFGSLMSLVIGWFTTQQQNQANANTAEQSAETSHQNDGSQSVEDKTSADAQNAALDKLEQQLDNPTPVTVSTEVKK